MSLTPYIVLDSEVARLPVSRSDWAHPEKLGLACAVAWIKRDDGTSEYLLCRGALLDQLPTLINSVRFVAGWNHVSFDYRVMAGLTPAITQKHNVDLCRLCGNASLEEIGLANFGWHKEVHSNNLPALWRMGECNAVMEQCRQHVEITRRIYDLALATGQVRAADGKVIRIPRSKLTGLPDLKARKEKRLW